jgi:hypothetical protein
VAVYFWVVFWENCRSSTNNSATFSAVKFVH